MRLRAWGFYFIPRDRAPKDEGFLILLERRKWKAHPVQQIEWVEEDGDELLMPVEGSRPIATAGTLTQLYKKIPYGELEDVIPERREAEIEEWEALGRPASEQKSATMSVEPTPARLRTIAVESLVDLRDSSEDPHTLRWAQEQLVELGLDPWTACDDRPSTPRAKES